jgi:hypothetical protein
VDTSRVSDSEGYGRHTGTAALGLLIYHPILGETSSMHAQQVAGSSDFRSIHF